MVAENCTTHPLHKAQNLMNNPLSAPAHPPPPLILFDQSLNIYYPYFSIHIRKEVHNSFATLQAFLFLIKKNFYLF